MGVATILAIFRPLRPPPPPPPHPKEAPYENWAKLAQRLQRSSRLKMLTDGRTDGRMDDGRKVITIAHPEQSSGELKIMYTPVNPSFTK